jgi:cobalamin biosynthesis Mg chelatase CobN
VSNGIVSHRQRRELTWWSSILYLLSPPHPSGSSPSGSGSGSGSGSSGSSGSSSTSTSESGSGSSASSSTYQEYIEGDTDGIANGDAVDDSEMESYYMAGGSAIASSAGGGSSGGGVGIFAYIVAALVATVIGAAMVAMWVSSVFAGDHCRRSFAISYRIPRS